MKVKFSTPRSLSLFTVVSVILLSYQNCTIYQSDAKKFLDENGFVSSSISGCLPYLSENTAVSIMGGEPVVSELSQNQFNILSCSIKVEGSSGQGIDSIDCTIGSSLNQVLADAESGTYPQDAQDIDLTNPFGQSGFGFGYTLDGPGGQVAYRYLGKIDENDAGVQCQMVFPSRANFSSNQEEATNRAVPLVFEIQNNL